MPPKSAKKNSAKKPAATGAAVVNKKWEPELIAAAFQEKSWQPFVSLVVEGGPEDEEATRVMYLAAKKPMRKLFSMLTRDDVLAKVHELGNPKAKLGDDTPVFYEVNEPAKARLDAGQEIPCDLMAKVLKFHLLQIKADDQQRREAEQAEKAGPAPAPSKEKGGPKKKNSPPPSKKTELKRRGDVEPPTYVDDEPEAGPQHYILLQGFYQPLLIAALEAVGVHVNSVIKLRLQFERTPDEQQEPCPGASPDPDAEDPSGARQAALDLFWAGLRPVLDSVTPESKLHDLVLLSYLAPEPSSPIHTQDPETQLDTGSRIFEGVAHLIYNCLDRRRQHQRYLDHMELISVPTMSRSSPQKGQVGSTPPTAEAKAPPSLDVDLRHYTALLDRVPPEACSVPLILHCMLEQVVLSTTQDLPSPSCVGEGEELGDYGGLRLDPELTGIMLQIFLPMARSEEEKKLMVHSTTRTAQTEKETKRILEEFGPKKSKPLVIRHHNERALRFRDVTTVQGFDPVKAESAMMKLSSVHRLIDSGDRLTGSASRWKATRQQLQHFYSNGVVMWMEVERLFHQSVFESMPLTRTDREGILPSGLGPLGPAQLREPPAIPWDDPLAFAKRQLNNLREEGRTCHTEGPGNTGMALSDIQRCRIRSLFDWHHTEHHDASILPQVLQAASEVYSCLDTFRGSSDNILYIFCHNPMGPHRRSEESWDVALHTDVKFRKYLEHVEDSISDWIKEEESKREAMQTTSLEDSAEEEVEESKEEEEAFEPVIRKDSLKAWKLEQERLQEEALAKASKKEKPAKGQKQKEEAKPAEKKRKSPPGRKKNSQEASSISAVAPKAPPNGEKTELQPTEKHKCFTGYSTDGRLIHASGRLQQLFLADGGQVAVETIRYTEGSSLFKVVVQKDGHRFCTHINEVLVVGSKPAPPSDHETTPCVHEPVAPTRVRQGSFTAVFHNGIHLSYSSYGPTGEHAVTPEDGDGPAAKTSAPGLSLSVPNGLLLQFLRGTTREDQGVLVKQSFPLRGRGVKGQLQDPAFSKELARIVTGQGAVIRYLVDGSTELLFPDGSVSSSPDSGPVWVPDADVGEVEASEERDEDVEDPGSRPAFGAQPGRWLTTTPLGKRIHTVGTTHERLDATPLLYYTATDPVSQEVMLTREDLVVSVQNPDGSLLVDHADGTRITTFYRDRTLNTPVHTGEWREDEEEAGDEEGGVSARERVVLVEKEGCATVVTYPERRSARVSLADGTVVTADDQGAYQVLPSNVGLLRIRSDGRSVYSSDHPLTPGPEGGALLNQSGSYTMSHTDQLACDVTDIDGKRYEVMMDGQLSVKRFSPAPSSSEEEEEDEEGQTDRIHPTHPPRLFLVHEDGSGSELLRSQTVDDLLRQATSDPNVVLLKELLPGTPDDFGVTILKPGHRTVWSQWLLRKQNPDIVPANLRNRPWHVFPEKDVGVTPATVKSCPEVIEIRELRQHRPITTQLRDDVDTRLKDFIQSLMARERRSDERKVKDPRSEEERSRSRDLLQLVPSFSEDEAAAPPMEKTTTEDVVQLYMRAAAEPVESGPEDPTPEPTDRFAGRAESKWSDRLKQHRQELAKEKAQRAALRTRTVVPYFHPENFLLYQTLLVDQNAASRDQPPAPASCFAEAPLDDAPLDDAPLDDAPLDDAPLDDAPQDSTPRPLNPTPSQSVSFEGGSGRKHEKRPTNPTPQSAGESSFRGLSGRFKSVHLDVTGEPRRTKVKLPACIMGSKPRREPNLQFLSVEEPVRRRCCTVSLMDPTAITRGFLLSPPSVDFGTLQEGSTSTVIVRMTNVSVDTCRFQVKQPPASSGLRVVYPGGPVPAGLQVDLQVQLFAAAAPPAAIREDIVILTEMETLYLPVTARINPVPPQGGALGSV